MKYVVLSLALAGAFLLSLFAVTSASAQSEDEYHLQQVTDIDEMALDVDDNGCWQIERASTATTVYLAIFASSPCSNSKSANYHPLPVAPEDAIGVAVDFTVEYLGSRSISVNTRGYIHGVNAEKMVAFGNVGTAQTIESGRACTRIGSGSEVFDGFGCDYTGEGWFSSSIKGGQSGFRLEVPSHDVDTTLDIHAVYWLMEGPDPNPDPPPNEFGLTCTITATTGVSNTVSASRVLNPSFETFNYGDLPAGWTVQGNSTFYATTTDAYDGDYSLQYQPNTYRHFAQACRSIQIPTDAQSIAAGVAYAGGGSGTSDVTLLLDGEILGTTTVSGSDSWTELTASEPYSSTEIFHQVCVEVQGANKTYIDATWLYASDSEDLLGLMCPADEDGDTVPPPPPPPPESGDDGIPTPVPDDFGRCYRCIRPTTILEIGSWIKWLLCGLQNLFRCELFLWLLNLQNLLAGLYGRFVAFVVWLPDSYQSVLNWFGSIVESVINWFLGIWNYFRTGFTNFLSGLLTRLLETEVVQRLWASVTWLGAIWEYVWSIIQAILEQVRTLFFAAVQVVELIQNIVSSVATAWTADPWEIDFIPGMGGAGGGGGGPEPMAALEADGINDSKVYFVLLMGLAALDAIAGDFGFQYLQFIIIGTMAFGVIAWTLKQFQDIIPT